MASLIKRGKTTTPNTELAAKPAESALKPHPFRLPRKDSVRLNPAWPEAMTFPYRLERPFRPSWKTT